MVSIHATYPLTFTRTYVNRLAIFGEEVSATLEAFTIHIIDELRGLDIRLYIAGKVYPARSHTFLLSEFFDFATCTDVVTGLPADLNVNVWIDTPEGESDLCLCISHSPSVRVATVLSLPIPPPDYWRPPAA